MTILAVAAIVALAAVAALCIYVKFGPVIIPGGYKWDPFLPPVIVVDNAIIPIPEWESAYEFWNRQGYPVYAVIAYENLEHNPQLKKHPLIHIESNILPFVQPQHKTALAITLTWETNPYRLEGAIVYVHPDIEQQDFATVAIHEMGHALGLGHARIDFPLVSFYLSPAGHPMSEHISSLKHGITDLRGLNGIRSHRRISDSTL